MRSNKLLPVFAAVILGGCASEPSLVTVDIALVSSEGLRPKPAERWDVPTVEMPPMGDASATLFGLQESATSHRELVQEAAHAQEILQHNRLVALRSLREQLFRSYRKEVDAWRQTESLELAKMQRRDVELAYEEIGAQLRAIAPERGQVLSQLAFLTTFPIQPPSTWPPVPAESPWRLRRREDALSLYANLKSIDQRFDLVATNILDEAQQRIKRRQNEFQLSYADRLNDARNRATQEADDLIQTSAKEVESKLANFAERPPLKVPPVIVTVPASPVSSSTIAPPQADPAAGAAAAERRAYHDLKIWLALKGYRLAEPAVAGRDVTEEFLQWRRARHPGP